MFFNDIVSYLERRPRGVIRPIVRRRQQRHRQLLGYHKDRGDAHVAQGVVPPQRGGPVDEGCKPADTSALVEGGTLFFQKKEKLNGIGGGGHVIAVMDPVVVLRLCDYGHSIFVYEAGTKKIRFSTDDVRRVPRT